MNLGDIVAFRTIFSGSGPNDDEPYIVTKYNRYDDYYEVISYDQPLRPVDWVLVYEKGEYYAKKGTSLSPLKRVPFRFARNTSSVLGQISDMRDVGDEEEVNSY